MRHNQNGRNMRGGRRHNGGHHQNNGSQNNNGHRRINPRVQTFDSNGPEVRVRGNAYQITEKYLSLARDATAAGDRVLAESYFQFAEHYQRIINEANEEMAQYQASLPQHQQHQPMADGQAADGQPHHQAGGETAAAEGGLSDLDQGFLVGNTRQVKIQQADSAAASEEAPQAPAAKPAQDAQPAAARTPRTQQRTRGSETA